GGRGNLDHENGQQYIQWRGYERREGSLLPRLRNPFAYIGHERGPCRGSHALDADYDFGHLKLLRPNSETCNVAAIIRQATPNHAPGALRICDGLGNPGCIVRSDHSFGFDIADLL